MTPTEQKVATIMAHHGAQLPIDEITQDTAMAQDAMIDGIDVDDFVGDLEAEFGPFVWEIPWARVSDQRASFRGCLAIVGLPLWLVVRLVHRPQGEAILGSVSV